MAWQSTEQHDTCRHIFETPHPYSPSFEKYQVIHFPEAEYIKIAFSNDCDTEFGYDFVTFFKGQIVLSIAAVVVVCSTIPEFNHPIYVQMSLAPSFGVEKGTVESSAGLARGGRSLLFFPPTD
jgi:hypothetical protein